MPTNHSEESLSRTATRAEAIVFQDNSLTQELYGGNDENLRTLEEALSVRLTSRGNELVVQGAKRDQLLAKKVLQECYALVEQRYPISPRVMKEAVKLLNENPETSLREIFLDNILNIKGRKIVRPRNESQKQYADAIRQHDIVFGIGPAGTGKTHVAVGAAVAALIDKQISRIILTRPAVEAGENLGFLPGTLSEKVDPYLRPLYDSLFDMVGADKVQKLMESDEIEIAPLAYMRGRTLNDCFVILDEAQNTTSEQMKMFLTRLGFNSKAVITGDVTQIDLPNGRTSGLVEAAGLLHDIEGLAFVHFAQKDIVRHPLVQEIVAAYDSDDDTEQKR